MIVMDLCISILSSGSFCQLGYFFSIDSENTCLLIGMFRSFTFNVSTAYYYVCLSVYCLFYLFYFFVPRFPLSCLLLGYLYNFQYLILSIVTFGITLCIIFLSVWPHFSVKEQTVTILGFACHVACFANYSIVPLECKSSLRQYVSDHSYIPIKHHLEKMDGKLDLACRPQFSNPCSRYYNIHIQFFIVYS